MGVQGLTTFISNRSDRYLQPIELYDTNLVIDGNSLVCQLYRWHSKCNDCFGGDYDKYAHVVNNFFQLLFDCHITPIVIFDGAYEKRKMQTIFSRIRNRLQSASKMDPTTSSTSLFPLFIHEVFTDIVLERKIKCFQCDFEGDSDCAALAKTLACPLLSYDSDFYIYDVLYIPFSTMSLSLRRRKQYNYIWCEMYNVDNFLNSFGGLNKVHLPLLAVLLGNDYVKKSVFRVFYSQIKLQRSKNSNEQQRLIQSIILWLKNESPESAIVKILSRYKVDKRKKLVDSIERAIEAYHSKSSPVLEYFQMSSTRRSVETIKVPEDLESIAEPQDDEVVEEEEEQMEVEDAENFDLEMDEAQETENKSKLHDLPTLFVSNYKKCIYPACFMDIVINHTYYCKPQVEVTSNAHSHTLFLPIIAAIHSILTPLSDKQLCCVTRNEHNKIVRVNLERRQLPTFVEINQMATGEKRKLFLSILDIDSNILDEFPANWHLFVIGLKYWLTKSDSSSMNCYLYSCIICAICLNFVDNSIGFYRSTRAFLSKFSNDITELKSKDKIDVTNLIESLNGIDKQNAINCHSKMIHYFQMEAKMKTNARLFDKHIVHEFAVMQSCFYHIKFLNLLFGSPFSQLEFCKFFDGTFLYNMTSNLLKRSDVNNYCKVLMENCPQVLAAFEFIIDLFERDAGENVISNQNVKRRRKKKKNAKKDVVASEEMMALKDDSEEECELDENNVYSLLNFVKD